MNQQLVKALVLEIDANLDKVRAAMRSGEKEVAGFAAKAKAATKDSAAGAEQLGTKYAGAARAAAGAMETIARTGKASGEAMKQLIAQGSNAALFFGPQGAFIGAIGITTLAVIGMFSRTREELAALERRTTETLNRFAEMDAAGQQRAIARLVVGDPFKQSLETIFATGDADARREAIRGRGRNTLGDDIALLRAELAGNMGRNLAGTGDVITGDASRVRELTRQIDELTRAHRELGGELEQMLPRGQASARQEQELKAAADGTKSATKDATEALRERAAAQKELTEESERLAASTNELLLKSIGSAAAQAAAPFDKLISQAMQLAGDGQDVATNFALVDQLTAARDQAVLAAEQLERFAQTFLMLDRAAAEGLSPTIHDFETIDRVVADAEERLRGLTEGSDDYRRVQAEINRLLERRKNLLKGVADADGDGAPDTKARDMADYAREVQQAADGALQLAQNLGGANEAMVGMLRAIGQIAGNLPALAKAIDAGSATGVIAAGLPILGALTSLFGSSPAQAQAAAELRENTKAIEAWTAKVGVLGGLDATGRDVAGASGDLRSFLASDRSRASFGSVDARRAAAAFGLDVPALEKLAATYGIVLNGTRQSFVDLQRALDDTIGKLGEFGADLESQQRQAEAEIALRGVTDPAERLRIRQAALAGRSSALDGVTAGLDLGTAEGRAQARANALAIFEVMRAGGATLDAAALGGLTGDELLQALLDLVDGLRELDDAVTGSASGSTIGGVSGFAGLTAASGARLEDYTRSLVTYARDAAAVRLAMLDRLDVLVARAASPIPVLPFGSGAAATGAGVGHAVQIFFGPDAVRVDIAVPGSGLGEIDRAMTEGIERAATDALYRGLMRARVAFGDLRVVSS